MFPKMNGKEQIFNRHCNLGQIQGRPQLQEEKDRGEGWPEKREMCKKTKIFLGRDSSQVLAKKNACVREARAHNQKPPMEFSVPPSISATMPFSPKGKGKSRYITGIATWVRYKVDLSYKRRRIEEKGDLKRERRCVKKQKYFWDETRPNFWQKKLLCARASSTLQRAAYGI